jgi:hypothetical protein
MPPVPHDLAFYVLHVPLVSYSPVDHWSILVDYRRRLGRGIILDDSRHVMHVAPWHGISTPLIGMFMSTKSQGLPRKGVGSKSISTEGDMLPTSPRRNPSAVRFSVLSETLRKYCRF